MSARVSRRRFLSTSAVAGLSLTALGRAPAYAQKRELSFLSWNHFVPAADDELRKQAEAFGKVAGATVRVDTIAHLQLPAKRAVEADGKPRRTEALNSYERRIVHMVVSEHPSLETYSVGEGADRRVTIAPRRAPGPGGDPAEPPRD